jgi:hypothetical protein
MMKRIPSCRDTQRRMWSTRYEVKVFKDALECAFIIRGRMFEVVALI